MCLDHQSQTESSASSVPGGVWRPDDTSKPIPQGTTDDIYRPDILDAIEKTIGELDAELRTLSLDIHSEYLILLAIIPSH